MPAFLQCEEGVRKETFVSLLRVEAEGHSLEPGLGGVSLRMQVRFLK